MVKVDLQANDASSRLRFAKFGEGHVAGAPIFVPRQSSGDDKAQREDDGYILTQLYRSMDHGTDIAILDAATLEQLALLRLDESYHVPYLFHGVWCKT